MIARMQKRCTLYELFRVVSCSTTMVKVKKNMNLIKIKL